jgi:competence protein ComEC
MADASGEVTVEQRSPARIDARLVAPALAAWLTAGLTVAWSSWVLAGLLWAASASAIAGSWALARHDGLSERRARWLVLVGVSLAAAALAATMTAGQFPVRHPPALEEATTASRHVELVAKAASTGYPGARFFSATVIEARIGTETTAVNVPVLVFAEPSERIPIGARFSIAGVLSATDSGDDVSYLVFADAAPRVLAPPTPVLAWGDALRSGFAGIAAQLPSDGGDLLPGLAIGETSAVGPDLDAAMKATSLSHLTAVSGANCAVIVGMLLALARALGLGRRSRTIAAMVGLLAFVVLVTPGASVLRAAVMAAVVLVAGIGGRSARGLPSLCVAVLGLLVVDPWLARDYGFALSVAATAALLLLVPPLAARLRRVLPAGVALVLAVPIAAQLSCQPILVLLDPALPVYGVVANLLAEPAAPVATVIGLFACLLAPWAPGPSLFVAWMAWLPAAWIAAVARFFEDATGARLPWLGGVAGAALLAVLTAVALAAVLAPTGRVRRGSVAIAALLVVVIGTATAVSSITERMSRPSDWEFAACDVGQGDAMLIRSDDQTALIDTGPEPDPLAACLDELGIDRLDLLVLTHFDLDHVGGADAVLGRVDRVLVGPSGEADDDALRERFAAAGARVEQTVDGARGTLGELDWTVLWPPASGVEPGNAASVALLVSGGQNCGCLSGLFLGDLGEESQRRVLASGRVRHVDVVKVAHHGSRDQDPRMYRATGATIGLIGVGADNRYGHPTDALLSMLAAAGTTPFRTDRDGMILVSAAAGGGVEVWSEQPAAVGAAG